MPLAQEALVWDTIERVAGPAVQPVLRPSTLAPGFDSITLISAHRGFFTVEYRGANQFLSILVGQPNPPSLDYNYQVTARNQRAILQYRSAANPGEFVRLWWKEPGYWDVASNLGTLDLIEYW